MTGATPRQAEIAMRSFDRSLPMALLRAREATMALFRPMLAAHNLTEQQWRVLRALAAADTALDVGQIAAQTFLLGPSLSRILNNLERRALVHRATAPEDARRAQLSLTEAGLSLVGGIAPTSEATYAQIENRFGSERLDGLLKLLDDLVLAGSDSE